MTDPKKKMFECPIVPVITIEELEQAAPLGLALQAAGYTALEITFRTPHAASAISAMKQACPELHIGAGTITGAPQFDAACSADSDFLVSPGTSDTLFKLFDTVDIPVFPGVASASEAISAFERGYQVQKFFPASAIGGSAALKALAAPLANISFMPTGGINGTNRQEYLSLPNVVAVGGSWMIDKAAVAQADWGQVTRFAQQQKSLDTTK